MTLTAVDHGGSIGFACSSSGSKDISTYLPSSCIDLTGTPIVGSPSTPTTSVPADGTLWGDLTPDEKASATACWDQAIATSVLGGIAWVVGSNTWHDQDEIRDIADTHLGGGGVSYLWLEWGACETTP